MKKNANLPALIFMFALLIVWQCIAMGMNAAYILPSPTQVLVRLWELRKPLFTAHLPATMLCTGVGLAISIALGLLLAIVMDASPSAEKMLYPLIVASQTDMVDMLKTFGAGKKEIFLKLKIPAALPYFFSALKMAIPMSIIGAAIGEWLGAQAGLGYFSRRMMTQLDGAGVFAPIVLLSVVAMIAVGIVSWLEKKIITWRSSL